MKNILKKWLLAIKPLIPTQLLVMRHGRVKAKTSYAQCGEDIIVDFLFMWLGKKNVTYLDIGANDPIALSNTYYFYRPGNLGVLVEPDPRLAARIRRKRPKDICLNAGVGVGGGAEMDFFLMIPDTLSTSSPEKAKEYFDLGIKLKEQFKIPLIDVNDLISKHFNGVAPDYLSVDVEGLDFDILKSLDLTRYRPVAICAETLTYTNNNSEKKIANITEYLRANNYFIYADTYLNTIYVDQAVWDARVKK